MHLRLAMYSSLVVNGMGSSLQSSGAGVAFRHSPT